MFSFSKKEVSSIANRPILVASFPADFYRSKTYNPYLPLFFEALRPYGIEQVRNVLFTKKFFADNRIDVLHLHWLHFFRTRGNFWAELKGIKNFLSVLFFCKKLGMNVVWTCHNFLPHENAGCFDFLLTLSALWIADLVICHSESAKRTLGLFNWNHSKFSVMSHGSYSNFLENKFQRNTARALLKIPETAFVYLYFGIARKYKGIDDLVDAFQKLSGNNFLYIVGENFGDQYLERSVFPKIKNSQNILYFPGCQDHEMQIFFNACDAVVYPFRKITSSGSLMLAYSFKKPVVVRDVSLARELFDEKTAVFFSNKKEFVSALANVQRLEAKRVEEIMAKQDSGFAWSEVVKDVADKYKNLIRHD